MKIFIETPRLILREMTLDDEAGIFELDSDPDVHKYLGNRPITYREEARASIEYIRKQYEQNGIGRWAVELKSTGEFMGWCGLKYINDMTINGQTNIYDVGYRFIKRFWRQGYGYEAAQVSLDYGFNEMGLKKIVGIADQRNIGSQRILTKIGLEYIEAFDFDTAPCFWYEKTV